MTTEITDTINGTVFFDGECPMCLRLAHRFGPLLHRRGFELVPLQVTWVAPALKVTRAELLEEMHLLCTDGRVLRGVEAYLEFARHGLLTRRLVPVARLPFIYPLLNRIYRYTAEHRHCTGGHCKIHRPVHHRTIPFMEMP